jgi:short-subunit dehydrogenase
MALYSERVLVKKAVIIGATSGIGFELAKLMLMDNYTLGLAGRRIERFDELKEKYPGRIFISKIDVNRVDEAVKSAGELIREMEGVDLFFISSGTGDINYELDLEKELGTVETNVSGFTAMANVAARYFDDKGSGHIAAISSIAAVRGGSASPAYNASKAYQTSYLQGLRQRGVKRKIDLVVTDIMPGFVKTEMMKGDGFFWVVSAEKAALQIYRALKKKKSHVYITKRWRLIAWLLRLLPDFLYNKI